MVQATRVAPARGRSVDAPACGQTWSLAIWTPWTAAFVERLRELGYPVRTAMGSEYLTNTAGIGSVVTERLAGAKSMTRGPGEVT